MLNVRLNDEENKRLTDYCKKSNLTKTQVVKEALAVYLTRHSPSGTPYELGEDLFGREGSGARGNSVNYKKLIKKRLNERRAH